MTRSTTTVEHQTATGRNEEERSRPAAGDVARQRMLAGLPVGERRLQLAGVSTAVLEGGEGPPVVLLHGPGEFAAKWMRVIPDLVTTHRVIAPDLPGHGTSEVTEGQLDADRIFAWLAELIERTCTSPPALVGHLLGGAIAARSVGARGRARAGSIPTGAEVRRRIGQPYRATDRAHTRPPLAALYGRPGWRARTDG
jgi:hypothetical protein